MGTYNEKEVKDLYAAAKNDGIDTGTEKDFQESLSDAESRKWYYDRLHSIGAYAGTEDEFNVLVGAGKAETVVSNQPGDDTVYEVDMSELQRQSAQTQSVTSVAQMQEAKEFNGYSALSNAYRVAGKLDQLPDYDTYKAGLSDEAKVGEWQQMLQQAGIKQGKAISRNDAEYMQGMAKAMADPANVELSDFEKSLIYLNATGKRAVYDTDTKRQRLNADGTPMYVYKVSIDPQDHRYLTQDGQVVINDYEVGKRQEAAWKMKGIDYKAVDNALLSGGEEAALAEIQRQTGYTLAKKNDKGETVTDMGGVQALWDQYVNNSEIWQNISGSMDEFEQMYEKEKKGHDFSKTSTADGSYQAALEAMPGYQEGGDNSPEARSVRVALQKFNEEAKNLDPQTRLQMGKNYFNALTQKLAQMNAPKSAFEYIVQGGLEDSILGTGVRALLDTDYQKYIHQIANSYAHTEQGKNDNSIYHAGMVSNAARGMTAFAFDMPFYELAGNLLARPATQLVSNVGKAAVRKVGASMGKDVMGNRMIGDLAKELMVTKGLAEIEAKTAATTLIDRATLMNSRAMRFANDAYKAGMSGAITFGSVDALRAPLELASEPLTIQTTNEDGTVTQTPVAEIIMQSVSEGKEMSAEDKDRLYEQAMTENRTFGDYLKHTVANAAWGAATGVAVSAKILPVEIWGKNSKAWVQSILPAAGFGTEVGAMTGVDIVRQVSAGALDTAVAEQNKYRAEMGLGKMSESEENAYRWNTLLSMSGEAYANTFANLIGFHGKEAARFLGSRRTADGRTWNLLDVGNNIVSNIRDRQWNANFNKAMTLTSYDKMYLRDNAPELVSIMSEVYSDAMSKGKLSEEELKTLQTQISLAASNSKMPAKLTQKVIYHATGLTPQVGLAHEVEMTPYGEGKYMVYALDAQGRTLDQQVYEDEASAQKALKDYEIEKETSRMWQNEHDITMNNVFDNFYHLVADDAISIRKEILDPNAQLSDQKAAKLDLWESMIRQQGEEGVHFADVMSKHNAGEELTSEEQRIYDTYVGCIREYCGKSEATEAFMKSVADRLGATYDQILSALRGHDMSEARDLDPDAVEVGKGTWRTKAEQEMVDAYIKAQDDYLRDPEAYRQQVEAESAKNEATNQKSAIVAEVRAGLDGQASGLTPQTHVMRVKRDEAAQHLAQAGFGDATPEELVTIANDTQRPQELRDAAQTLLYGNDALEGARAELDAKVEEMADTYARMYSEFENRAMDAEETPMGTLDRATLVNGREVYITRGKYGVDDLLEVQYADNGEIDHIKSSSIKAGTYREDDIVQMLEDYRASTTRQYGEIFDEMTRGGKIQQGEAILVEGKSETVIGPAVDESGQEKLGVYAVKTAEGKTEERTAEQIYEGRDNVVRVQMQAEYEAKQTRAALDAERMDRRAGKQSEDNENALAAIAPTVTPVTEDEEIPTAEVLEEAPATLESNGRNSDGKLVSWPTDAEGNTNFADLDVAEAYDMHEANNGKGSARELAMKGLESVDREIEIARNWKPEGSDLADLARQQSEHNAEMTKLLKKQRFMRMMIDESGRRQMQDKNFVGVVDSLESDAIRKQAPEWYEPIVRMAEQTGMKVRFVYGLTDENGKEVNGINHDAENLIEINTNPTISESRINALGERVSLVNSAVDITPESIRQNFTDYLSAVTGHEITHELFRRGKDNEALKTFVEQVKQYIGEEKYNQLRANKLKGSAYTEETVDEEIICDLAGEMLSNREFMDSLFKRAEKEIEDGTNDTGDTGVFGFLRKIFKPFNDALDRLMDADVREEIEKAADKKSDTDKSETKTDVKSSAKERAEIMVSMRDNLAKAFTELSEVQRTKIAEQTDGAVDEKHSKRTKADPIETRDVYKLMRLMPGSTPENPILQTLFIGRENYEVGQWYDAESPAIKDLESLDNDYAYLVDAEGNVVDKTPVRREHDKKGWRTKGLPNKKAVVEANNNSQRWITKYMDGNGKQAYKNVGINGAEGVTEYAMRPGIHAGSLPTMHQIGSGKTRDLRDDNLVWVKGKVAYGAGAPEEAEAKGGEINTHIPQDGGYMKGTSNFVDTKRMNWYISGAFLPEKIISDDEARAVIDQHNKSNGLTADDAVPYDFSRRGGRKFYADTMTVEEDREVAARDNMVRESLVESMQLREEDRKRAVTGTYSRRDGKKTSYVQLEFDFDGFAGEEEKTLVDFRLRPLKPGETCQVERRYEESKMFTFTGAEKISSPEDLAYMFRNLEDSAIEHTFMVLVKDGKPTILHTGMGFMTGSPLDQIAPIMAIDNIKPQAIFMLHNHPSGTLVPSRDDRNLYGSLKFMYGDRLQDGIIIDQKSGKYATFNDREQSTADRPMGVDNEKEYKVYSFTKNVFAPDYSFEGERIDTMDKVAAFVSSHRLGDRGKLGVIIGSNALAVNGNVILDVNDIDESNYIDVARQIVSDATAMSGRCVYLYGSGGINCDVADKLNNAIKKLSGNTIYLMDAVKMDGNNVYSAQSLLHEDIAEYGGNKLSDRVPTEKPVIQPGEDISAFNERMKEWNAVQKGHRSRKSNYHPSVTLEQADRLDATYVRYNDKDKYNRALNVATDIRKQYDDIKANYTDDNRLTTEQHRNARVKAADKAVMELFDNTVWNPVMSVPTHIPEVANWLEGHGWNGDDALAYATEAGYISHHAVHHPGEFTADVDPKGYDMQENANNPYVIGYTEKQPNSLVMLRKDAADKYYATIITVGEHAYIDDGKIQWQTDFGKTKNPYKKLIPIWTSDSRLLTTETGSNASEGVLNNDAKVQQNPKTAKFSGANLLKSANFNTSSVEKRSVREEIDREYLEAVNSGDMDKAARLFDAAARESGYTGTTEYQGNWYNGPAPSANAYYGSKEERKEAYEGGEFEGDWSLGDYIDNGIDNNDLDWQLNNIVRAGRKETTRESINNINSAIKNGGRTIKMYRAVDGSIKEDHFRNGDWITPSKKYAQEHIGIQNWDSGRIIEDEVSVDDVWWDGNDINEWGYDDGKSYKYKNTSNNRKLDEVVTYDDNGNVIPLSERFNEAIRDERYSRRDKTLIGVHNLSEASLRNALKLGGLANPSMAVVDTRHHTHDEFGEISLIPPSTLIDQRTGNNAGTWTDDIWSPTFPAVFTMFTSKGAKKFSSLMNEAGGNRTHARWLQGSTISDMESGREPDLRWLYLLKEKGIDATEYDHPGFDGRMRNAMEYKTFASFAKAMAKNENLKKNVDGALSSYVGNIAREEVKAEYPRQENESDYEYYKRTKDAVRAILAKYSDENGLYSEDILKTFFDEQKSKFAVNRLVNHLTTNSRARELVERKKLDRDYQVWLNKTLQDLGVENLMRKGYDRNGNARYKALTLSNVSDMMNENQRLTGNGMGGWSSFIGEIAKRMTSLDEIKQHKSDLDPEGKQALNRDTFTECVIMLNDKSSNLDLWDGSASRALAHIVSDASDIKKFAKKKYGITLSDDEVEQIKDFKVAFDNRIVDYFETKFQRPVAFGEFAAAVVPNKVGADITEALVKQGLRVIKYNPNKEGDREKKMATASRMKGVKFSERNAEDIFNETDRNGGMDFVYSKVNQINNTYGREEIRKVGGRAFTGTDGENVANAFAGVAEILERIYRGSGIKREKSWRRESVLETLKEEAKRRGAFVEYDVFKPLSKFRRGGENEVYRAQEGIYKLNDFSFVDSKFRLNEFLDRIVAHNEFAADVPYVIEGFTNNSKGEFSIVLSQPYIKGTHPSQAEIDADMKKRGFKKTMVDADEEGKTEGWSNGKYDIWDTKPSNVLTDENGDMHYIDTMIQHSTIPNHDNPNRFSTREEIQRQGEEQIRQMLDARNAEINGKSTPQARLRAARELYSGTAGETYLTDEMMEPQTLEEYVSNLGSHTIAWDDVERGGHIVRGLKTELGTKRGVGADTSGINDFLAKSGEGAGIDEVVHGLWEGRPVQFEEYSDMDIKAALLDVLSSSESAAKTRNMVLENRLASAREAAEAEEYEILEEAIAQGAQQYETVGTAPKPKSHSRKRKGEVSDDEKANLWRHYEERMRAYKKMVDDSYQRYKHEALERARNAEQRTRDEKQKAFDNEKARNNVIKEIKAIIDSPMASHMQKSDLNRLLAKVEHATPENQADMIAEAQNVARDIQTRIYGKQLADIMNLKTQDRNGRNMSIAKNVSNDVRVVLDNIRNRMYGVTLTESDERISYLRRENLRLREQNRRTNIVIAREHYQEGTPEYENAVASIEANEATIADNTEQMRRLSEIRDTIIGQNLGEMGEDIALEIQKMEEHAEDCADPNTNTRWTNEDTQRYATLDILNARYDIETTDRAIRDMQKQKAEIADTPADQLGLRDGQTKAGRLRAIDQLINDQKRERLIKVKALVDKVQDLVEGGKSSLMVRKAAEIRHRSDLIRGVMGDIDGGKRVSEAEYEKRKIEDTVKALVTAPLGSFEYMAHRIDVNHLSRDGFFYRAFVSGPEGVMACESNYLSALHDSMNELQSQTKEMLGMTMEELAKKQCKPEDNHGITLMEKYDDGMPTGERMPIKDSLSKANATYLWMVWQMPDGRAKMVNEGYDERSMSEIREFIGEKNVAWAEWVQGTYLPKIFERYNARYTEMFGTPMTANENYVPLRYSSMATPGEKNDLSGDKVVSNNVQQRNTSMINRTVNLLPISKAENPFTLVAQHVNEAEEYISFARIRKDLEDVLNSKAVQVQLDTNVKGQYQALRDAAMIATHSTPNETVKGVDRLVAAASKGLIGANIAFRTTTALKQVLSVPAFLGYSQDPVFLGHFFKNFGVEYTRNAPAVAANAATFGFAYKHMLQQLNDNKMRTVLSGTIKWAMENVPSFRSRVEKGNMGMEVLNVEAYDNAISQMLDKVMSQGMTTNKLVDAITCAVGIKSIYDYNMGNAEKRIAEDTSLTEEERAQKREEAKRMALVEADIYYNGTQQSNHVAFMSPMQLSKTALNRMMSVYQNASIGFARKAAESAQDLWKLRNPGRMRRAYEDMYMREGMSAEEAVNKAEEATSKKLRGRLVSLLMYGIGTNLIWDVGSRGLIGLFQSEDDKKQMFSWNKMLSYPMRGMPMLNMGASLIDSVNGIITGEGSQSREYNPFLMFSELSDMVGAVGRDYKEHGVSPITAIHILNRAGKFTGVNPDVLGNTYLAIEDMIKNGFTNPSNIDWMTDLMLLLQTPNTNRASVTKELQKRAGVDYESLKELTEEERNKKIEEYAAALMYAMKYYPENDWHVYVPGTKVLTDGKRDFIVKQLKDELIPDEVKGRIMRNDPTLKKELDGVKEIDDLVERYDKEANAKDKVQIGKEIRKRMGVEDTDLAESLQEGIAPFFSDAEKKRQQKIEEEYAKHANADDLKEDLRLDAALQKGADISSRLKDFESSSERTEYRDVHVEELRNHRALSIHKRIINKLRARLIRSDVSEQEKQDILKRIRELRKESLKAVSD